jgi:4-carboxymuconolactone decarboxylase
MVDWIDQPSENAMNTKIASGLLLVCVLGLLFFASPMASAQDRMPPIAADKLTGTQKKAVDEFRTVRGNDISGPFIPLLRSPEVMTRARAMGDYLRFKSALPARLSEFVILMTARKWTQNYEWNAHAPLALKGGLKPEVVNAIAEGRRPTAMTRDEQALYDLVDELERNQSVSDPTYTNAIAAVGEQGLVDAVALVGQYSMLAMILNTARTPLPDGAKPALKAFPK